MSAAVRGPEREEAFGFPSARTVPARPSLTLFSRGGPRLRQADSEERSVHTGSSPELSDPFGS